MSENGTGFVSHWAIRGGGGRGRRVRGGGCRGTGGGVSVGGVAGRFWDRVESGNGIGFVWHSRVSQQKDVLQAALIHIVEAGFIAVEEGEATGTVRVLEGGSEEAGSIARVGDVEAAVEALGFDGPGAADAPLGDDHFLNDGELDAVGGLKAVDVVGEDFLKTGWRFVIQPDDFGEQSVAAGVLGRQALAGLRDRASGAGAVGAGRFDLA